MTTSRVLSRALSKDDIPKWRILLFWDKVDKREPDDCWEWTAGKNKGGYGHFRTNSRNKELAHRSVYVLEKGDIPEGMLICHTCDNPSCVNPAHLFLGTAVDNLRDMTKKGRHGKASKLTEDQVREIRNDKDKYTAESVAKFYGISKQVVWNIQAHRRWKHLK